MANYRDQDLYQSKAQSSLLQGQVAVRKYDTAGLETQEAIAYQKSQEIDDVQAGIKEIAECQKTLATMVDQQGSNISQAQADVEDARDKAAEGVNQLQGANKHAKAARKRMCCAFILLLIIVGVIVIVVVVKK